MAENGTNTAHSGARAMLEAFASVGATGFNVTWTNLQDQPRRSHKGITVAQITRAMPRMLDAAIADTLNLIVRPYGRDVWFIQLDDLTAEQLPRLAPRIFLILETSPGNHQAWAALPGQHDKEFARRVRRGAGTDKRATGATRVAGSLNFKEKYDPEKTGKPCRAWRSTARSPATGRPPPSLSSWGLSHPRKNLRRSSPSDHRPGRADGRATRWPLSARP